MSLMIWWIVGVVITRLALHLSHLKMKNKQDRKVKDNACEFIWLEIILAHYRESSLPG